jgi:hypothetical protein
LLRQGGHAQRCDEGASCHQSSLADHQCLIRKMGSLPIQ